MYILKLSFTKFTVVYVGASYDGKCRFVSHDSDGTPYTFDIAVDEIDLLISPYVSNK
ncbi:MAG: hypothetical protein Q4E84_05070 [Clostridia bacterium]|nr:hypothetical protein [Clostridia bacterium]